MSLGNIGSNATEEFFETILYGTAYAEAQNQIKGITGDVDNALLQDAIQSSMNILASGAMFVLMQKQEQVISRIFVVAEGIISVLLASSFFGTFKNRLRGFKGVKLLNRLGFFNGQVSDKVSVAGVVSTVANSQTVGTVSKSNGANNPAFAMQQKQYMIKKENHQFQVGSEKAKSYQTTLLFKLFSQNFTATDQAVVRKILGNSSSDMSDVDNLNKVSEFMFVKDNNGDITGLSEQMFQLLNGMSYTHK